MRNFRSISCAFSAAYRARTGPHHTVRIPQYMVRKFRRQWCGNSARSVHFRSISCDFRWSFCASARSCAEIPHGPIRKLASICITELTHCQILTLLLCHHNVNTVRFSPCHSVTTELTHCQILTLPLCHKSINR